MRIGLSPPHRVLALRSVGLLLAYPDQDLLDRTELLHQVAARLPAAMAARLSRFLDHLESAPLADLQSSYVDTFDLRRRCCLYLTYYAFGDTRRRGMALLRFTDAYRRAGAVRADEELADHLGVVCEFAAAQLGPGLELLAEHRVGIEMLRLALEEADSPYLDVVEALRAALPDPAPADLDRALDLARSGPPAEQVGLEPFAPPEYMGARR
jgi:nitrate reductase molybdenum cofactor assembly chaperone NarJ/NarW